MKRKNDHFLIKEKYTSTDYKQYQKNFGFGREFLPFEYETKQEKIEKARKREEYSKMIKERNTLNNNTNNNGSNNNINTSLVNTKFNNDPVTSRRVELDNLKRNNLKVN